MDTVTHWQHSDIQTVSRKLASLFWKTHFTTFLEVKPFVWLFPASKAKKKLKIKSYRDIINYQSDAKEEKKLLFL